MIIKNGYDLLKEIKMKEKNVSLSWNDVIQLEGIMENIKNLNIYNNFNEFIENIFIKLIENNNIKEPDNYSIYIKEYDITIFFYMDVVNFENIEICVFFISKGFNKIGVKKTFSFDKNKFEIVFEEKSNDIRSVFERLCMCLIKTNYGYDYFDILDMYKKNPNYDLLEKKFKNFLKMLKKDDSIFSNKEIGKEIYDMV